MQHADELALLTKNTKGVRACIINKLSQQWPLTLKQLHQHAIRDAGLNVSYQAIHKAIQQLEEEKIIAKGEKGYQLHAEWIKSVTHLAQGITHSYSQHEIVDPSKEIIQMTLPNWLAVGKYCAFKFDIEYPNPSNKPTLCNWVHVWPVVGLSPEETQTLIHMYQNETHYSICPNDTPIDRAMAEWLNKINKKTKTGVTATFDYDYLVKGDYICQIHFPKPFQEEIHQFYLETKDFTKMDYHKLQHLIMKEVGIQLIIIKNEKLAEQLREMTIKYFTKGKK